MTTSMIENSAVKLARLIREEIPLADCMQLQGGCFEQDCLSLHVPLQPNRNDKGCAFGGSMVSLMTLCGWGLVVIKLQDQELLCDVYVQSSTVDYRRPAWSDFHAEAVLVEGESWDRFFTTLAARGKARATLAVDLRTEDGIVATMSARYVALRRLGS